MLVDGRTEGNVTKEGGADAEVGDHAERDRAVLEEPGGYRSIVAEARLQDPKRRLREDGTDDQTDGGRVRPGVCSGSAGHAVATDGHLTPASCRTSKSMATLPSMRLAVVS